MRSFPRPTPPPGGPPQLGGPAPASLFAASDPEESSPARSSDRRPRDANARGYPGTGDRGPISLDDEDFATQAAAVEQLERRRPLVRSQVADADEGGSPEPQSHQRLRTLSTPKPQKAWRKAEETPTKCSPAKRSPQHCSPSRHMNRPPSKSRLRDRHARRSPSQNCERAQSCPSNRAPRPRQLPKWDWTHSDMSRYQLTPAEQLRRHLLRISRHHSDASVQVQDKLKRMQENIAPFVHEWNTVPPSLEAPAGKTGKGASHMTPCFASRVPTGRFPEEPQGIQRSPPPKGIAGRKEGFFGNMYLEMPPSGVQASAMGNRSNSWKIARPFQTAQGQFSEQPDNLIDEDAQLSQALEDEIKLFFKGMGDYHDHGGSGGSRPQYRVLRRAREQAGVASDGAKIVDEFRHRPTQPRSAFRSSATLSSPSYRSESDSELGELEEDAGMLESQLAWWRQHKETLLNFGGYGRGQQDIVADRVQVDNLPFAGRGQDHDGELVGRSDWLQLSSPSDVAIGPAHSHLGAPTLAAWSSASHAALAPVSLSLEPESRIGEWPLSEDGRPSVASGEVSQSSKGLGAAADREFDGKLSDLVSEQVRELVDSTMNLLTAQPLDDRHGISSGTSSFSAVVVSPSLNTATPVTGKTQLLENSQALAAVHNEEVSDDAAQYLRWTAEEVEDSDCHAASLQAPFEFVVASTSSGMQVPTSEQDLDAIEQAPSSSELPTSAPVPQLLQPASEPAASLPIAESTRSASSTLPEVRWYAQGHPHNSAGAAIPVQQQEARFGSASALGAAVKDAVPNRVAQKPRPKAGALRLPAPAAAAATLKLALEWSDELAGAGSAGAHPATMQVSEDFCASAAFRPVQDLPRCASSSEPTASSEVPQLEIRNFDDLFNM